jgi:hypothetical protein
LARVLGSPPASFSSQWTFRKFVQGGAAYRHCCRITLLPERWQHMSLLEQMKTALAIARQPTDDAGA